MPANNVPTGFLSGMGIGVDRAKAIQESDQAGMSPQAAGRIFGSILGGGVQAARGKGEGSGFFDRLNSNVTKTQKNVEDQIVARKMGIPVDQLRQRQDLEKKVEAYKATATNPLDAQIETLSYAFRNTGDPQIKAQIQQQLQQLRQQKVNLSKLDGEARSKQQAANEAEAGDLDNITVDGKVMSASIDPVTHTAIANGKVFSPGEFAVGDTTEDESATNKPIHERLRKAMTPSEQKGHREALTSSLEAVRGYGKVLSGITDAVNADGGVSYLGRGPQALLTFGDQLTRQVNSIAKTMGVAEPFVDGVEPKYQGAQGQANYSRDLQSRAREGFWDTRIPLPPGMQQASAAAQAYKSNIIQLAYMEARSREPSNRGLSDNDIERALEGLGANSANPQVILRNFSEKVVQQAAKFHDTMDTLPVLEGRTSDEVRDAIYGPKWRDYDGRVQDFKDTFGITGTDQFGRVTFDEPVDTDRQPGEGVLTHGKPEEDTESDPEADALAEFERLQKGG